MCRVVTIALLENTHSENIRAGAQSELMSRPECVFSSKAIVTTRNVLLIKEFCDTSGKKNVSCSDDCLT